MFAEIKVFFNKLNIDVSSLLMSSLRALVICQKYFGNHVISPQINLFAPLLNMSRCTLCIFNSIVSREKRRDLTQFYDKSPIHTFK